MNKANFFPNNILQVVLLFALLLLSGAILMAIIEFVLKLNNTVKSNEDLQIYVLLILTLFISTIHLKNKLSRISFSYGFNFRYLNVIVELISIILLIQFGVIGSLSIISSHYQISNPFNENFLHVFSILIFAPVVEEFLFRGIILKGLLNRYSLFKALFISTFFFLLAHANFDKFNYLQVLLALIIGVFFGWIYYRSNNLLLCIILHAITNFFGMFFEYLQFINLNRNHVIQKFSFNFFILLIVSVVFIVFLTQKVKNKTIEFKE